MADMKLNWFPWLYDLLKKPNKELSEIIKQSAKDSFKESIKYRRPPRIRC